MSSKTEKDKAKQLQDKCQAVLNGLLRDEDNKYCVDCDSKGPRWASWNIGVFLCIRCAGIHRNLGVHISRVKSVNLDSWTPEQVASLQQMGNSRARAVYEANLPDAFRRPQSDAALEAFVRAKYEQRRYIAREWVPPPPPAVDWEREIDEEIEKQRRRRRAAAAADRRAQGGATAGTGQGGGSAVVVPPQLPKPRNAGVGARPGGAVAVTTAAAATGVTATTASQQVEVKHEDDFLGLQNGEDSFSSFLSAPIGLLPPDGLKKPADQQPQQQQQQQQSEAIKSEEESFFNQTAPAEKEKVKLTKDSILALYGNTPPLNAYHQNAYMQSTGSQQPFGAPATSQQPFVYPQQTYPSPAQQQQNGLVHNHYPTYTGQAHFIAIGPQQAHQPQASASLPFVHSIPASFVGQGAYQAGGGQFAQFHQFAQPAGAPAATFAQPQPNPFFGAAAGGPAAGLQQQFSSLSLGNQTGPTLASNLFQ